MLKDKQRKLDLIQLWLSRTTEMFDEWDYDGKLLIIFLKGEVIERYSNKEIKNFIRGF